VFDLVNTKFYAVEQRYPLPVCKLGQMSSLEGVVHLQESINIVI